MSRQTLFGPFTQLIKVSLDSIILGVCCTKAINLFPQTIVFFHTIVLLLLGVKSLEKVQYYRPPTAKGILFLNQKQAISISK